MPADLISPTARNTDLDLLHPVLRDAVTAVQSDLEAAGIPLFVFEAYRSPRRQAFLFAKGRTTPGPKVTFAQPWQSYHQFGLAVDLVFGGPGKWSWEEPHAGDWKRMHEIAKHHGLMPLDFETPHVQLAGTSSNALREGHFPSDGDETWAENMAAACAHWDSTPAAPPAPTIAEKPAVG
jgi:peptidoglycan L-alanyl-D-glutamate endopeptidase CwlK